jgi:hypothetical protein
MEHAACLARILRTAFRRALPYGLVTVVLASAALAEPIKYTAFTITDGQLGSWAFHNARVILTFVSDTNNVQSNVHFPPKDVTVI